MNDGFDVLKSLLQDELRLLAKAEAHLLHTYQKCRELKLHTDISEDDLELLDSLCSRFVRFYEVYLKNVIRTSLHIMRAHQDTFIDNMNKAEKIGLIDSMKIMDKERTLRNQVSHQYNEEDWIVIFSAVLDLIDPLTASKNTTMLYIDRKIFSQ